MELTFTVWVLIKSLAYFDQGPKFPANIWMKLNNHQPR